MSKRNNTLRSTILVTLLVLSFVLVGCTPPAAAPAAAPTAAPAAAAPTEAPAAAAPAVKAMDPKDIKLAGIVFQDDQFMNTMVKGYKAAADKYGVSIVTANTNNDQSKETELIQTYMAQDISGLAISPISEVASIPNLQEAAKKGMAIAVANTALKDTSFTTGSYTSDNAQNGLLVGQKAAEFIKANMKGPVNIGILEFDSLLPEQSKARWGGFLDGLKAAGVTDAKVVTQQSAWLQDTALTAMSDMLTAHPEIQLIYASNEGGTIGATQAVKQAGKAGQIYVFGYDGSDQITTMLLDKDNILQGVVTQDPYNIAFKAVESLVQYLTGTPSPDMGKNTIVNGTYLDRANPDGINQWRTDNGLSAAARAAPAAAAPAVKAMDPKDIKLAGIVFQDDQFMNTMVKGYKAAADKYGVSIVTANTNNDQSKETELIQTYMAQDISGLAISPISEVASIPNLQEAAKKGMAIAVANTALKDTSFTTGSYTSDNAQNGLLVGQKAAEFIKANMKGPVNIGILEFDSLLPEQSKARWGGFLDGLKAAGVTDAKVVTQQSAWLQDTALTAMSDMLTAHPEIQLIYASNEGGTIGATQAVKQAGKAGQIYVFGYDGSDQITTMLLDKDNILQGVVTQDPYNIAFKAVESLVQYLTGTPSPDMGKNTIVNGTYLDRANPDGINQWRTDNGLK